MLRPEDPNLLKYLKQSGYDVHWGRQERPPSPAAFAAERDGLPARGALAPGPPRRARRPPYPLDDPRYYTFLYEPIEGGLEAVGDFRQVDGAVEFLRQRPRDPVSPFAIYLPLSFPHCPYHAPQPYHSMVDPGSLRPCARPTSRISRSTTA